MSVIKNFFKKRKQDVLFSMAGPGRRLCDESSSSSTPRGAESSPHTPRAAPTASAQRAGEAALSRFEEKARPRPARPKTQSSGVAEDVRQEIADERRQLEEATRLAEIYGEKKEKELEASPLLKVESVRFMCELLGEERGTFQEIESRIADFLTMSLATEPLQAGALCILTLEKNTELRQACCTTLEKLIENLQADINNPKFRRVRLKNKVIEQRIVAVKGAVQFLEGVGFERHEEAVTDAGAGEEKLLEPVLLLPPEKCLSADHLTECLEALQNAEAIRPTLFRNSTVFCATGLRPAQLSRVELPSEFYRISPEELKKEQEIRRQAVEQMGMLRTKAMREREAQRELRRYRFCLLRVRFPDNTVLQGVFFAHDKVLTVIDWVRNSLVFNFVPFRLTTPSGQKVEAGPDGGEMTLAELGLAPASVLSFEFDAEVLQDVLMGQGQTGAVVQYLNEDLLAGAKPL